MISFILSHFSPRECFTLYSGVDCLDINSQFCLELRKDAIFVGSFRFKLTLIYLIESLEFSKFAGKAHVFSNSDLPLDRGTNYGFRPEIEILKVSRQCEIGILPLSLSDDECIAVENSFPSKFWFYMKAGVPVFYHGPDYFGLAKFLDYFDIPHRLSLSGLSKSSKNAGIQNVHSTILGEWDRYIEYLKEEI